MRFRSSEQQGSGPNRGPYHWQLYPGSILQSFFTAESWRRARNDTHPRGCVSRLHDAGAAPVAPHVAVATRRQTCSGTAGSTKNLHRFVLSALGNTIRGNLATLAARRQPSCCPLVAVDTALAMTLSATELGRALTQLAIRQTIRATARFSVEQQRRTVHSLIEFTGALPMLRRRVRENMGLALGSDVPVQSDSRYFHHLGWYLGNALSTFHHGLRI